MLYGNIHNEFFATQVKLLPAPLAAALEFLRDNEKVLQIEKDQLFDDYNWTDEMYDMLLKTRELTEAHPVFDYMKTVNDNVYDLINNPSKESYNQGTPWTESVEEIKYAVQAELDAANVKLAALKD